MNENSDNLDHYFKEILGKLDTITDILKPKEEKKPEIFEDKDIALIQSDKKDVEDKIIQFIFE